MSALLLSIFASWAFDTRAMQSGSTRGHERNPGEGPTTTWKAELKLTLERRGKEWVFVLRGTSSIPEEVRLRACVVVVESVYDPVQGRREDEEPLVWEDDDVQPRRARVERASGRFSTELCRFARTPWSLLYRSRLEYRPQDQTDEVVRRWGDQAWALHVDLRVGSRASFA